MYKNCIDEYSVSQIDHTHVFIPRIPFSFLFFCRFLDILFSDILISPGSALSNLAHFHEVLVAGREGL